VVIGYDLWQSRLAADPDVIGKTVRLGRVPTTVVGVMPEGFAFPVAHGLWTPLQSALAYGPREGPGIQVFGRLAPGATLVRAQAELTVLGDGIAVEFPETHEHLRPQVMPYARAILNVPGSISSFAMSSMIMSSNLPLVLFLVLVCGNVALLMFARAAAREGEMVVRSALGASRGRIVSQLFAEALVLAAAAAVVGLGAVSFGLRWAFGMIEAELIGRGQLPFWFHPSLSPGTLVYAGVLMVFAAAVAGVLPALKVTRGVGAQLRRASAGGGGFRFGGLWTAIIVCQIAVTVAFPVMTLALRAEAVRVKAADIGFPAADYLGARLEMAREAGPDVDADSSRARFQTRYQIAVQELEEDLLAIPHVAGVTFTERLPRMYHPWRQIEVDGGAAPPPDERGHRLGSTSIDVDYLRVLGIDVLSGRDFHSGDLDADPGPVIVNESFVRRVLGGRNPIGRRVRYIATEEYRSPDQAPGPWHEIVGVVEDLGTISGYGPQGMYHPAAPGDVYPVHIAVQVKGGAQPFTPRLQRVALAVDPTLRLHDLMTLEEVTDSEQQFYAFWFGLLLTVTSIALLLSLGGIYAIMSFTVSQRTREIGIRVALGSNRPRVLGAILRRPISQVGLGVLSGGGLLAVVLLTAAESVSLSDLGVLAVYVAFMMAVCMLACIVPARRALSVDPSEALRADG
jgi:predicted permease